MRITDTQLTRISLGMSTLGIMGLLIITSTTDTTIPLSAALAATEDTTVTLNTTITRISHHGNITFLELQEQCTLPAVLFKHINITTPSKAIITGTIAFHKGERELIVENIRKP